jgi:KTSC domain
MADETAVQGDPFNMTAVSSSQIEAVGFNPDTNQGRVAFLPKGNNAGSLYEYDSCTQEEASEIVNAPSVGQAFAQTWKGVKPYRRIS